MKPIFAVATVALVCLLTGCAKNTPKDVAREWLTDFYHMDFESAKKYSTEETKIMLNTIEGFSASFADSIKQNAKKVNVTIKGVREEGDKAFVTFAASNDPNATEPPLKLLKQNDKWLVQFTKNDFKPEENKDDDMSSSGVSITPGAPAADSAAENASAADTGKH